MQEVLFIGLIAYCLFGLSTSIDKKVMNEGLGALEANTVKMFFDFVFLFLGALVVGVNFDLKTIAWCFFLGLLYASSGILYFKTLKQEKAGVAIPYMQAASTLLIFLGSVFWLMEKVVFLNYLGIALIVFGIHAVLSEKLFQKPVLGKNFVLMSSVVLLITVHSLTVKNVLGSSEPLAVALLMYFFTSLFLFAYSKRKKVSLSFKHPQLLLAAFLGSTGTFVLYNALSLSNASKVYPISGLQSVIVFLVALFFLKEKLKWHKSLGVITVFAGIYLISV